MSSMTSFFDSANSAGVRESARPMTGMTLTRGARRFISSMSNSRRLYNISAKVQIRRLAIRYVPVTCRCDEVEHGVNAVVSEARITLDTRLLGQNVVVLPLEKANNFRKADSPESALNLQVVVYVRDLGVAPSLIVDLVTEAGSVNDGQRNTGSLLVKLKLCSASQIPIELFLGCGRHFVPTV